MLENPLEAKLPAGLNNVVITLSDAIKFKQPRTVSIREKKIIKGKIWGIK